MRIAIVAVELRDGDEYKGWDQGRVTVPAPTDLVSLDETLSSVLPYSTFARAITLANVETDDPRADMVRDGFLGTGTLGHAASLAGMTFKHDDDDDDTAPGEDVAATLGKVTAALDNIMSRLERIEATGNAVALDATDQ